MAKISKIRKIALGLLLVFATTFPKLGLIHKQKSVKELDEDGEVPLGI